MEKEYKFSVRLIESNDKKLILNWRNNSETRASSFNQNLISEEEHESWFSSLGTSQLQGFMGIMDVKKEVCVVTFKSISSIQSEISINMNPAYRGLGFSKEFLNLAIKQYRKSSTVEIVARIKKSNVKSQVIFRDLGFQITNSESSGEIKMIFGTSSK